MTSITPNPTDAPATGAGDAAGSLALVGRLLIVDDNEMNRDMLSRRLARRGHTVDVASGGKQALAMLLGDAAHTAPAFDVVLLDIMMPDVDGLTVLRTLRERYPATALPVIMATAKDAAEDVVEALRLGANDYVTKPLEFSVVVARIATQLSLKRAVDRIVQLEQDLQRRNDDLLSANTKMRNDLQLAAGVQQAMLPTHVPESAAAKFIWRYVPCEELAGDILNIFTLDDQHIAFYLVDVSGHGVAASLLSCTLSKLLAPATAVGGVSLVQVIDPSTNELRPVAPIFIAQQLNARFQMDANAGQYFTLFYGVLNTLTGELRFVSAGHPCLVHAPSAGESRAIKSPGWAIGWFDEATWEEATLTLKQGDRLYICSDGIVEARDASGEQFANEGVIAAVTARAAEPLHDAADHVLKSASSFAVRMKDDVSMIALEFAPTDTVS